MEKLPILDSIYLKSIEIFLHLLDIELEVINQTSHFHPLCVSNHVSELDPIILYYIFMKNNASYRFISDVKVKNIPIFGRISDGKNTIYIDRTKPKEAIQILTNQVSSTDTICLFPEGTLYYKPMIQKSNNICKKNVIPRFRNVLCPKIHGYNEIMKKIQPKYITDSTLHYIYSKKQKYRLKKQENPLTIYELFKNPPKKICVIIQEKSCENIVSLFREKDAEMKDFLEKIVI
jgi:hypothetical protein